MTRAIESASVICMSWMLARSVVVRSDSTEMSMPSGIRRWSVGISALMRSTVSMTLASALLVMLSRIAGWLLNMAEDLALRVACFTSATAPRRTTSPFTVLTTILL